MLFVFSDYFPSVQNHAFTVPVYHFTSWGPEELGARLIEPPCLNPRFLRHYQTVLDITMLLIGSESTSELYIKARTERVEGRNRIHFVDFTA